MCRLLAHQFSRGHVNRVESGEITWCATALHCGCISTSTLVRVHSGFEFHYGHSSKIKRFRYCTDEIWMFANRDNVYLQLVTKIR